MSTNVESGALDGAAKEATADVVQIDVDGPPHPVGGEEVGENEQHDVDEDLDLGVDGDDEIMEMQHKIQELEDEAERLRQMTEQGRQVLGFQWPSMGVRCNREW